MAEEPLVLYTAEDHIALITLNRPEKMKARNQPMRKFFQDALS